MKKESIKQHLSLLMLFSRSSVYKILLLLAALCAAQIFLFWRKLSDALVPLEYDQEQLWSLETILDYSRVDWVAALAFAGLAVILCMTGCERGSKQGYTLKRLSVSERTVFLWQAAYNAGCFLILWAVEIMLMWGLCLWYTNVADPAVVSGQTVFLAFYRQEFLHGLLPLEDGVGWTRNLFLVVGLGITSAAFPFRQRRGKFGAEILSLALLTILWFGRLPGDFINEYLTMVLATSVAAESVYYVLATTNEEAGPHEQWHWKWRRKEGAQDET